jgi:cytosine/adenosine deaminase-related metal-dependent hydrolase
MGYRKFRADQLFTGYEMTAEGSVLVTGEDGTVQSVLPAAEAGDGVEELRGILSPGFINCHCHLELSHMKGVIPERTGLVGFLLRVIQGREGSTPDLSLSLKLGAIAAAEEAMLHEGIVAVGDICNTTDSLEQKKAGNLLYHNFIEAMGFSEAAAAGRLESSRQVFNAFAEAYSLPVEANSLVPHAPYSVSPGLFGLIAGFPGNHLLTIHNQESEAENDFFLSGGGDFLRLYEALGLDTSFFRGTGKRSLESWLPHFYPNQSLILVHNVATSEEDLRFARGWQSGPGSGGSRGERPGLRDKSSLYFCLCPNANLYITGQLPDVDLLLRHDCRIVLGTDSLASNHRLSILEEMKTLQRQYPQLPTGTLLQWATSGGAEALQLDKLLGSFTPGKQPGVVLIENCEGGRLGDRAAVRRLV